MCHNSCQRLWESFKATIEVPGQSATHTESSVCLEHTIQYVYNHNQLVETVSLSTQQTHQLLSVSCSVSAVNNNMYGSQYMLKTQGDLQGVITSGESPEMGSSVCPEMYFQTFTGVNIAGNGPTP